MRTAQDWENTISAVSHLGDPGELVRFITNIQTDARSDLLDRIKEAEWLLRQPLLAKMNDQSALTDWHKRHEAWLKGGAK